MENKCIICGSSKLKKVKAKVDAFLIERMFGAEPKTTDFLICEDCKIEYFSLRPTDENMRACYKNYMEQEYVDHRDKFSQGFAKLRNDYIENGGLTREIISRKKIMKELLDKHINYPEIKSVLDFGGNRGEFILDDFINAEKYVYEISGNMPEDGVKMINHESDLKSFNWDFIMCCHVLEHVSYPKEIIEKLTSLMNVGNYLYIEVPYERCRVNRIFSMLRDIIRRPRLIKYIFKLDEFRPIYMTEHINGFATETFNKVFTDSNFKIIHNNILINKDLFYNNKVIGCLVQKIK